MKTISILGSTGSIGTQTLDVIRHDRGRYRVAALAAGSNVDLLVRQALEFRPAVVCLATKEAAERARSMLPDDIRVLHGEEGLIEAAAGAGAELVVTALVGSRGIRSTIAAIEAGAAIGLANKETLVAAGHLVTRLARERGVPILPVDSEHSAIFQCLNGERRADVMKLTLTASGGAFRDRTRDQLKDVTVAEALAHPNWKMGAKITVDSATMANKGLEVIEARWLYDMDYDRIDVLLHPESIVHSLVEFADRSVIAQLSMPDMRIPIQYALTWPERRPSPAPPLDLAAIGRLHFRPMDYERYPCLRMAYEAGRAGGSAPLVFNAANEAAVERFLRGDISFLQIEDTIAAMLERFPPEPVDTYEAIAELDERVRREAMAIRWP
ncbi:MAG: 1-deoxy-D-xylulose-5-phosphate reductoisomerase [Thermobacillus sp. ZCTH02-B1]|uniref:1-deoxy-D-xylulose-5-phosphate reductoisomerase n=1 Tax=Thermobacillus sp. ZCTH02-B1 TaxID=1858795 RepID=UPI000B58354B|nr:1-deoxy-D-xylulose-5-phosphate reductoisomerase [Thermobacillus sp. ZCTH02-B1]OUM96946.1 MAG: 1-deoxy-D-xylulose-5-phosphate reductoisomerase [Thermobacillus sp. ZCTH02-B1]